MKKILTAVFVLSAIFCCIALSSCVHAHEWSEWEIIDIPTCTEQGLRKRSCKCGAEDAEVLEAQGHKEGNDATCTEGQICLDCGETLAFAKGHTAGADATCTTPQICTACNAELAPALGHVEGEWVVDLEPTCTTDGAKHKACSVCDEVINTEVIAATGHTEMIDAAVAPTCTGTGLTEGIHCLVCSEVIVAQEEIAALGHSFVTDAYIAPTCSSYGRTEGSHCETCGEIKVATQRIDMLEHTPVKDEAKSPTCTEAGLTEGSHCSVCDRILVAQRTVDAKGHDFNMRTNRCTRCNEREYTFEITNNSEYEVLKNEKEIVFYLDSYVSVGDENAYYFPVSRNTEFLRIVGNAERTFKFRIEIEKRTTPIRIELVDLNASSASSIVFCESEVDVEVGIYGEICTLKCDQAKAGANESILELTPKKGNKGASAIGVNGNLALIFAADSIYIEGGKGGRGGNAKDTWGYDADDGADGGDGGFAISASTISVAFENGVDEDDVILVGGEGGEGGKGGEATGIFGGDSVLYDDGEDGDRGADSAPTNVEITYK